MSLVVYDTLTIIRQVTTNTIESLQMYMLLDTYIDISRL